MRLHKPFERLRLRWPNATVVIGTVAALSFVSAATAQESLRNRSYHAFLWMKDGPPIDRKLFRALESLGISGTNVAGTAPSDAHGKAEIPFYVDHVAGKGILQLDPRTFAQARAEWMLDEDPRRLVRPRCIHDKAVAARLDTRMREVLDKALPNRPLALALDDEISLTLRNNPFDYCLGERTAEVFRAWLVGRYGSRAAVARAWECPVEALDDLTLATTQGVRRRAFIEPSLQWNFAPWNDLREFMELEFTRLIGDLAAKARRTSKGLPTGFTGGEAPSPFSGVDWARMLSVVDFVEPYDVGGSRELVRSFARPRTLVARTIFKHPRDPRFNVHELWDYMLRGDRAAIIWCAGEAFAERRADRPTAWIRRLAPTLIEFGDGSLDRFMAAEPPRPEVAIVESRRSNRLHWMLDSRFDGRDWINRTGSYEATHSSQNRTREAWQKLLEDLHVDYEHIDAERLETANLARYKVLILPRLISLSRGEARAIERFAATRTVIADCQLGLFDENLRAREIPILDECFGVTRFAGDPEPDSQTRHGPKRQNRRLNLDPNTLKYTGPIDVRHVRLLLAESGTRPRGGVPSMLAIDDRPALITRTSPKTGGRTVYLNLLLTDYLQQRLGAVDEHELVEELRGLLRAAGVMAPIAEVRSHDPDSSILPVRFFVRRAGSTTWLALLANWRTTTIPIDDDGILQSSPQSMEILFRRACTVTTIRPDKRSGSATANTTLENVSSITVELPVFEPVILRIDG